jgi:nucleoside-diphosphate-sugar epimerase
MQVLVTGGYGFIGRYVIDILLERGYRVEALDHHRAGDSAPLPVDVSVFMGDVRDDVAVTEAMAHADAWIHLAAVLGTQETIFNPKPAIMTNMEGGLNVLEGASQYRLPGSYICVGNHWMNNPYSISKSAVERLCLMYNADRGTSINCVRAVNAYGPHQVAAPPFGPGKVRKIIPAFACRALTGRPVEVYGDGEQISDMVYVGDVAEALVRGMEYAAEGKVAERVIEIGPAEHATVNEVAECVIESAYDQVGLRSTLEHLPMRPGEIPGAAVTADVETLRQIGIDPADLVGLDVGIPKTVEWFAAAKGSLWDG